MDRVEAPEGSLYSNVKVRNPGYARYRAHIGQLIKARKERKWATNSYEKFTCSMSEGLYGQSDCRYDSTLKMSLKFRDVAAEMTNKVSATINLVS
jgi:hypothetical protein